MMIFYDDLSISAQKLLIIMANQPPAMGNYPKADTGIYRIRGGDDRLVSTQAARDQHVMNNR
jgi:hypothetical protein